ncbi:hypothetical protein ACP70R_020743 [Stipagrostis hirtigluma subsp. patula]
MAEAIVGPLLSKLQEVAVTEAKALAGVGGEIDSLRDKLMWLHALLHEIEQRGRHDGSRFRGVLAWQIREVALQAEDAVDEFNLRAGLSRRGWRRAALELVTNLRTQVRVRFALSREIQSLNARLEEIIDNSGKYGTVYAAGQGSEDDGIWKWPSTVPRIRREWNWYWDEDSEPFKLIGRETEKSELLEKLKDTSGEQVIYLVGRSGIGKRALLRQIYEDADIRGHFKVCISVSFAESASEESIVQQIEGQLVKECSLFSTTKKKDLSSIQCMVLINSPINTAKWSTVEKKLLEMTKEGTKIVLSAKSRSEEMEDSVIELKPLDDKGCLELFMYALGSRGPTTVEVPEKIFKMSGGLPLAVVLAAKFMTTIKPSKWTKAAEYIADHGSSNPDDNLRTILLVSIDDLPDEIKSCLLYTAGFPENRVIDAKQLVRLWMAEGFLAPQHGMEAEELGQCYLKELIHRGLLQMIKMDGGDVHSVAIHDLIHPTFRSEVRRTAFMYVHRRGRVAAPESTRRLALQNYDNRFLPLGDCYGKLRTVVSFCYDERGDPEDASTDEEGQRNDEVKCWPRFKFGSSSASHEDQQKRGNEPVLDISPLLRGSPFLRVFNLEGLDIGPCLPEAIGEMVHLRYLGVRCRLLRKVPSSIGNLRKLQTMDVRGTQVRELPSSFWKIRTLRHVLGDSLGFPRSSVDVEFMYTMGTVTIHGMKHWNRRWIRGLRYLHRLHVVDLSESQKKDLETVLRDLRCLQSLTLWGSGESGVIPIDLFAGASVPGSIFYCLEHVVSLELRGEIRLPAASPKMVRDNRCLFNLTHLVLRSTGVGQDFIDAVGMLPALAKFSLLKDSYTDKELRLCAQGFISLRELRLYGLPKLKKITGPADTKRNRMKETISATVIKLSRRVTYETHKGCDFCDTSSSFQPKGQQPAAGRSSQAQPAGISQEISEGVQTGMSPIPTRGKQKKNKDAHGGHVTQTKQNDAKATGSKQAMGRRWSQMRLLVPRAVPEGAHSQSRLIGRQHRMVSIRRRHFGREIEAAITGERKR